MSKLLVFFKNNWLLIIILLAALFVRSYKPLELFMYSHDQDLSGWIVKDILYNHHLRLIGQETSSKGIFIGPVFYYLQIPFYLLTKMDPSGLLLLSIIFGVLTVFSFYFVFSRIFNKKVGLIAALIYAISTVIVFTDREAVPTVPVMLWTVWYFYCLWKILNKDQRYYILVGLLFGLVWDLSLALALLSPLVVIAHLFSKQKIEFKRIFVALSIFIVLMTPFFVFEARHGFQQTKSLIASFTTSKDYVAGTAKGWAKTDRILQLVHTNTTRIFWSSTSNIPAANTFYVLVFVFLLLVVTKVLTKEMAVLMLLWQILFVLFFTFNSINVSEYYINGMNVVWIAIAAVGVGKLLENNNAKYLGFVLIGIFVYVCWVGFFSYHVNASGYIERKEVVAYIDQDAKAHNYPCVSVSYITSPGNNLGYRYLFWLKGMHVDLPAGGAPVYSIVYPLSGVNKFDKTFGALGVILPDYKKYTKMGVEKSCSGENQNVTGSMFGYTQ